MKKTRTYLGIVLLLATAVACGKQVTEPAGPTELTLRPVAEASPSGAQADEADGEAGSKAATKADPELPGTSLGTDNIYVIYLSAYHPQQPSFMEGQLYSYIEGNSKWEASSGIGTADPLYWPVGQEQMDFLAYACKPEAQTALGPDVEDIIDWNASIPANGFTITDWDTYTHQYDLMYAAANGRTAGNTGVVNLVFSHAMAVVGFTAVSTVADVFTINSITINGLEYAGTFTVDNSRTSLTAAWSGLTAADKVVYSLAGDTDPYDFVVPTSATQCTRHLLVPQQAARSFTLHYSIAGSDVIFDYTIAVPRMTWKKGYQYIYAISFTPTEITATPTVIDWVGSVDTIQI